jgi:hypothetical protein
MSIRLMIVSPFESRNTNLRSPELFQGRRNYAGDRRNPPTAALVKLPPALLPPAAAGARCRSPAAAPRHGRQVRSRPIGELCPQALDNEITDGFCHGGRCAPHLVGNRAGGGGDKLARV